MLVCLYSHNCTSLNNKALLNHNRREIVLLQGDCRKNCNYDYINRLAFRFFISQRFIQILSVGHFVLGHNLHEEIISQLSSVLIEAF